MESPCVSVERTPRAGRAQAAHEPAFPEPKRSPIGTPMPSSLTLFDFWRSGTSHRLRTALHLKGLSFEHRPLDLRAGAQSSSDYLGLNPQGLVPTLIADGVAITQSPAILEWLEEVYPDPALL